MTLRLIRGGSPPPVPVIAGADGARQGPVPPCVACGADSVTRVPAILGDGTAAVVCLDPVACTRRYRRGVSPANYAAAELRGDLLMAASL